MKKALLSMVMAVCITVGMVGCGSAGFNAQKNISVTAREDGSGTKSSFMELVGLKEKADPTGVIIQTGTAGVLSEVKSNPSAIAYESLGYVTDEVKMISVDGVEASVESIRDGSYKIARPLALVYKEDDVNADPVRGAFLAFLESTQAETLIVDNGYIPVVEKTSDYEANADLAGTIDISGSTSLQPLMLILAREFENLQPNVTITVSGGGSGTGYKNASNGTSGFGMISTDFEQENAPSCKNYTVAKDGIAIIVNKENPIEDISLDSLMKIYDVDAKEDAIKTWSQLVG